MGIAMRNILSGRTSKTLTLSEALCLQQKMYGLKEALELWSCVTSKNRQMCIKLAQN